MDMGSRYEWQIAIPRDTLDVKLISHNPKHPFVADLQLRRQPMRQNTLLKLLLRHPCMPGQIAARIYYQALLLWWKRCPFFPYPQPKLDEKQRATAARNKPMTKTRQT